LPLAIGVSTRCAWLYLVFIFKALIGAWCGVSKKLAGNSGMAVLYGRCHQFNGMPLIAMQAN